MLITLCKAKLHRARVTEVDINYEGSLTVDEALLEQAGILPYEKVLVANLSNGERFETYAIQGRRGSGMVCLNGAAARLGKVGDILIVLTFAQVEESEAKSFRPRILVLGPRNEILERR